MNRSKDKGQPTKLMSCLLEDNVNFTKNVHIKYMSSALMVKIAYYNRLKKVTENWECILSRGNIHFGCGHFFINTFYYT